MNTLIGHIKEVNSTEHLSLVTISVGPFTLSSVIIDTPDTVDYLKEGEEVQVVFKETEVVIGLGEELKVSLRNQLTGTISNIEPGPLLSRVVVQTEVGSITAIITTNATRALQLTVGKKAMAMIKTNEIMLSH